PPRRPRPEGGARRHRDRQAAGPPAAQDHLSSREPPRALPSPVLGSHPVPRPSLRCFRVILRRAPALRRRGEGTGIFHEGPPMSARLLAPPDLPDPVEAWKPWEPTEADPWNLRWAGHLYRRAGFGATRDELDEAVRTGFPGTLQRILGGDPKRAAR